MINHFANKVMFIYILKKFAFLSYSQVSFRWLWRFLRVRLGHLERRTARRPFWTREQDLLHWRLVGRLLTLLRFLGLFPPNLGIDENMHLRGGRKRKRKEKEFFLDCCKGKGQGWKFCWSYSTWERREDYTHIFYFFNFLVLYIHDI